jgi:hypothetical protein
MVLFPGKGLGALVSERTRKQIEVGLELTQDGMGTVVPFAKRFLAGDFVDFDGREAKARPPSIAAAAAAAAGDSASAEVMGWLALFDARDLARAATEFEQVRTALTNAEREHRALWTYFQASAEFLRHRLDEQSDALNQCLRAFKQAIDEGGSTSWFNRLRKAYNRLAGEAVVVAIPRHDTTLDRWDELVERYSYHRARFQKWQARLREYLDGIHAQVCEALETLGATLGFNASRPPGDGAADGLWLARDHAVTWEAKIELDRDAIVRADVNQADGHRRRVETEHRLTSEQVGSVIVTRVAKIDPTAVASLGQTRVLNLDVVDDLQARLEAIMREYWKGWTHGEAEKRQALRAAAAGKLPASGWLLRAIRATKDPFIDAAVLFREWR